MKGGIRFLEIILFFELYKSSELNDIILLYAHRHIALNDFSQSRKLFFNLLWYNYWQPCWRKCRLLCKLTVGSSLTVFLRMWITRILVIWIQNLWQDVSNWKHLHLSCN